MRRMGSWLLLVALAGAGCQGVVGDQGGFGGGAGGGPGGPGSLEEPTAEPPPFQLDRATPQLLPLHVRIQRVATVLGVTTDDALFAEIRRQRIALGDYDHAAQVLPDPTWNASRIALWARLMRPICASDAMTARYPSLPADLPALVEAAYGREAEADEIADMQSVIGAMALDEAARYETFCLAVLGSAEMNLQ